MVKAARPSTISLPAGVRLLPLEMNRDDRGVFTEVFRRSWDIGVEPVQWNFVTSQAGVLRGVHVHVRHVDYLIVLEGRASIGLRDLRRGSPTEGTAALVEMTGDELMALTTPPGVAHGFYFHEPSAHIYAVSQYWDVADEFGCHWADGDLEIPWPCQSPLLSERDATAPPLSELMAALEPYQPIASA